MLETSIHLEEVEPQLRKVILAAAEEYPGIVVIVEAARTLERQKKLKAAGASRTLKSRHIRQKDGFAHAVDVGFRIDPPARVSFDWPLYYALAPYVRKWARHHKVKVTWGAIWDTPINDIEGDLKEAHAAYVARFRKMFGRSPLADGPHFQT